MIEEMPDLVWLLAIMPAALLGGTVRDSEQRARLPIG
jgi:hypothetical protein